MRSLRFGIPATGKGRCIPGAAKSGLFFLAVTAAAQAEPLLEAWRKLPEGANAAIVGHVETGAAHTVLKTRIGGERLLDDLEDCSC